MEILATLRMCGIPPIAHLHEVEQLKSLIMKDAIASIGKHVLTFFGRALTFQ